MRRRSIERSPAPWKRLREVRRSRDRQRLEVLHLRPRAQERPRRELCACVDLLRCPRVRIAVRGGLHEHQDGLRTRDCARIVTSRLRANVNHGVVRKRVRTKERLKLAGVVRCEKDIVPHVGKTLEFRLPRENHGRRACGPRHANGARRIRTK